MGRGGVGAGRVILLLGSMAGALLLFLTWFATLALIAEDGRIKKVFYPVFPPDRNADDVLACLRSGAQQ